jgi:molecular chaperone HscA
MLNADGILVVEAIELRSGVRQEIKIVPQYGLSDKEVETMLLAAMQFAEDDMHKRILAEARTEAEQIIYQCNKLIYKNSELLSDSEKNDVRNSINELRNVLSSEDKEAINAAMERLNTISRPFAERLMDEAIGKALTGKKLDAI